jgi:hypothetical protein
MQAAQSLEVQLAALAAWETYIFGRLKTFKVLILLIRASTADPVAAEHRTHQGLGAAHCHGSLQGDQGTSCC